MILFYFTLAFAAGVTTVVARIVNSHLAGKIGLLQGTFYNYVMGILSASIILLFSNEVNQLSSLDFSSIPVKAYFGGIFGIAVVVLSSYVTPRISVFYQTLFVFIGQIFVGIIVDYFVLNQLSVGKIIGGILVLFGLLYNLMIDKKDAEIQFIEN